MLEANINANQLAKNIQNVHPSQIIGLAEGLSQEVKFYQVCLAQSLQLNTLLVQQASTIPTKNLPFNNFSLYNFHQSLAANQHHNVKLEQQESSSPELNQNDVIKRQRKTTDKSIKKEQDQQEQCHDKNETKNIPKNYGKAILSFIQKNIQKHLNVIKPILQRQKMTTCDLLAHIKRHKKEVNSINYLKLMWGHQNTNDPIYKCIRILSYTFMRKHCLSYIFNSRVKNYTTHIKYRKRIIQGIENPAEFTCIKQF